MQPRNSPLDYLAAFAIVFAAGILSTASLAVYLEWARRSANSGHSKRTQRVAEGLFPLATGRSTFE